MTNFKNSIETSLAIRKPISEVYQAFVDPIITSKFWFTKSSGKLEQGAKILWEWEMYGIDVPLKVKELVVDQRIMIEWGEGEHLSNVEWTFESINDSLTYVTIKNYNLRSEGKILINKMMDSVGGFTFVLAGLKAYLEHGIELNLVGDKFPEEMR